MELYWAFICYVQRTNDTNLIPINGVELHYFADGL